MSDLSEHVSAVRKLVQDFYASQSREVPFHGWHHVKFVAERSNEFAEELGADPAMVAIAAYVHDVNYLLAPRSGARKGVELRREILIEAGLTPEIVQEVEEIVVSAETHSRNGDISAEAMALSDADTLFKALPITPVKLAPLYMYETGRSLRELANKIVREQTPLRDQGIYFYSESAKKRYQAWAEVNLQLWSFMLEAIKEPSIAALVNEVDDYAKKIGLP
jgi:uncharacterized protein